MKIKLFLALAAPSLFLLLIGYVFFRIYPQEFRNLIVYFFTSDDFYKVEGNSMIPTLHDKQMWYGRPCLDNNCRNSLRRGDLVVFDATNMFGVKDVVIKRVIGIPLDRITILNEKILVNDHLLNEPYLSQEAKTHRDNRVCVRFGLGNDEVFVAGDNRSHSGDSRYYGPLNINDILSMSEFEKYNSPTKPPFVDELNVTKVDEKECPLWEKP